DRRAHRREPLDETVDELALQEHPVGAGLPDRVVQLRRLVARERDQAERRMVVAQPRDGGDAVQQGHVQVDHNRVGIELVGLLDRLQSVLGEADDSKLRLAVDQLAERFEKITVIVCEEDSNPLTVGLLHSTKVISSLCACNRTESPSRSSARASTSARAGGVSTWDLRRFATPASPRASNAWGEPSSTGETSRARFPRRLRWGTSACASSSRSSRRASGLRSSWRR